MYRVVKRSDGLYWPQVRLFWRNVTDKGFASPGEAWGMLPHDT